MITGASEADAAVLVVSAKKGEEDVALGPGGQAREHAFLLRTLGVNQLVVIINKMDDQTVKYSEQRYNEAKQDVENLLKTVGYNISEDQHHPGLRLDRREPGKEVDQHALVQGTDSPGGAGRVRASRRSPSTSR